MCLTHARLGFRVPRHFHIDHCAALPYFTERQHGFRGRVFATHSTIMVMRMMLADYIRVTNISASALYNEEDLRRCMDRITPIDYKQTFIVDGVKFMLYPAGHVLGAAMVMLDFAGTRVLYTGDYSLDEDRHLMAAETPVDHAPHVLIIESTFGMQNHASREEREKLFTSACVRRRCARVCAPTALSWVTLTVCVSIVACRRCSRGGTAWWQRAHSCVRTRAGAGAAAHSRCALLAAPSSAACSCYLVGWSGARDCCRVPVL